jgi:hypothetical protein
MEARKKRLRNAQLWKEESTMKVVLVCVAVLCMAGMVYGQVIYELPMDQQVNNDPGGDPAFDTIQPRAGYTMSFEPDPGDGMGGFTRLLLPQGYYYGPDVFPVNDVGHTLDLSRPEGIKIEFDVRVYQDEFLNSNPYDDANCFIYLRDVNGYYFGLTMLYQTNTDWGPGHPQYPDWYHVKHMFYPSDTATGEWPTDPDFDATQVDRITFRGTDWNTTVPDTDWQDVRNLVIMPEPGALALLALGALAVIRRR